MTPAAWHLAGFHVGCRHASMVFLYAAATLALASSASPTDVVTQESCQADTFAATCEDGHVIIMQSALYGRMKQGRCVKGDYGHLGCSRNALPFMEAECSGRRECRFRVFDSPLRDQSPCPEDMASYLESSYTCLNVASGDRSQCLQSRPIVLTSSMATLSSSTSEDTGLGTVECPWTVRASPGQRIVVTLRYFGLQHQPDQQSQRGDFGQLVASPSGNRKPIQSMRSPGSIGGCYELATLRETLMPPTGDSPGTGAEFRSITTCDGRAPGEHEVYRSQSHELTITVVGRMALKSLGKFIIGYRVFGCADIVTPFNATVLRDGDRLTVKCNRSEQIWYLMCVNNSWQGEPITCNGGDSGAWKMKPIFDVSSFPYGILVVVAVGVALGIFCGGLLLACVVVYMKSERRMQLNRRDLSSGADYRCDADGYYGTGVVGGGRRSSFDHAGPPLLIASDEELHEKTAVFGQTQTMAYPGLVHCSSVAGGGALPHQACLSTAGGMLGGQRPLGMPRGIGYGLTGPASELCSDCCVTEYDVGGRANRHPKMSTTGTLCHGVDVTMTTTAGTTRLPQSAGGVPHTHVYELPNAV